MIIIHLFDLMIILNPNMQKSCGGFVSDQLIVSNFLGIVLIEFNYFILINQLNAVFFFGLKYVFNKYCD